MAGIQKNARIPDELIERCQHGDKDAIQELFKKTSKEVLRILYRLVGPCRDMEDLVQQVYLALLGALGRFERRSSFSTYLFAICQKVVKKRDRSLWRRMRLHSAVVREPKKPVDQPDADLDRLHRAEEVHRALGRISLRHRTVLVLFVMEGLSGSEVAKRLGIPEATVWTRLHRARNDFRRSFSWESTENKSAAQT
jgi:RNA polymerase sigma-70 factor (ECF subfamily)